MTNLLARMKTYNFWISLVSAVILVLRIIGDKFNFFVDATLIMDITTGLCGIFVVLGIISAPSGKKEEKMEQVENATGRFEQINAEKELIKNEAIEKLDRTNEDNNAEEIETDLSVEENGERDNEIELSFETDDVIVEKSTIIAENIQSENKNEQNEIVFTKDDKKEIIDMLEILIEKFTNM